MKKCNICKKEFDKPGRGTEAIFCSRKCKVKNKQKKYLKYRKEVCECCGFIPVNMCQLDTDHIDGNKKNNNIENLQTLCSNCHRLKTYLNKDWE